MVKGTGKKPSPRSLKCLNAVLSHLKTRSFRSKCGTYFMVVGLMSTAWSSPFKAIRSTFSTSGIAVADLFKIHRRLPRMQSAGFKIICLSVVPFLPTCQSRRPQFSRTFQSRRKRVQTTARQAESLTNFPGFPFFCHRRVNEKPSSRRTGKRAVVVGAKISRRRRRCPCPWRLQAICCPASETF